MKHNWSKLTTVVMIACLIMLLVCGGCSANPANKADTGQADADLQAMLEDPLAPISGLSVLAIKGGDIVYRQNMGYKYIDNNNPANSLPIDENTRFRIASVSKVFTAVAVMQLVEQGKIDLDGDISDYLGFSARNPNYPDTAITPRMLLSHTSSLRDGSVYSIAPEYSIQELLEAGGNYYRDGEHWANSDDGRDQSPGVFFAYCNLNFGTLGTIIENVSGIRFDEYMKANVLEPMGLKASYNVGDFDENEIANVSALYKKCDSDEVWDVDGPWIAQIDEYNGAVQSRELILVTNPDLQKTEMASLDNYRIGTNATIFSPQGGLRISASELAVLMQMFMNDGKVGNTVILKPETVDLMFTPQWTYDTEKDNGNTYGGLMDCYGLSIQIMTNMEYDRLLAERDIAMSGHFGEAYGLLSGMFMDREAKNGFIYIMNGMGAPEDENYGEYSGMYLWEEKFCTAILDNIFPE